MMEGLVEECLRLPVILILLFAALVSVRGQYSIKVHLSSVTSTEGDQLEVNCDVTNRHENSSFFIVWVKRGHGEEVEIGTNGHINDVFNRTGRYKARYDVRAPNDYGKVNFYLTITNLTSTDSGEIGCRIPNNVEILRKFTVVVPVTSVRLLSHNMDKTHGVVYENGQNVTFVEDERRKFSCLVNGSYPQPEVKVMIGRRDITHLFDVSAELVKDGPVKGLQAHYYRVNLINPRLEMKYEFSHETMTCSARDPDHVLPAKSTAINVHLSGYRPKFRCSRQSIPRMYQANVNVSCTVFAEPSVESAAVRWKRLQSQEQDMAIKAGHSDGHYSVELVHGKSANEAVITLTIDKAFPQTFRTYYFEAANRLGTSVYEVDLSKPGSPQSLLSDSGQLVSSALQLSIITAILFIV